MPHNRRRLALQVVLAAALIAGSVSAAPASPDPHPVAAAQLERPAPLCQGARAGEDAPACYQRRATEATEAQAEWAERQFWIAVGGTVAVVLSLILSALATRAAALSVKVARAAATDAAAGAKAAAASVEIARRAFVTENRPWVGLPSEKIVGLSFRKGEGAKIEMTFTLENAGRTPAHNVAMYARLTFANPPAETVADVERRFRAERTPDEDYITCLFPGQTYDLTLGVLCPWDDLRRAMASEDRRGLICTLSGFVTYGVDSLGASEAVHATSFVYRIAWPGNEYIAWSGEPLRIEGDNLQIRRWPRGWLAD